jgi:hypothetical protein
VKLAAGGSAADGVIDECRRAEHTKQHGKSKHEALAEFKKVAAKLYRQNGEPLPKVEAPKPPPVAETSAAPPPPAPPAAQPLPVEISAGETKVESSPAEDLSSAARITSPIDHANPDAAKVVASPFEKAIEPTLPASTTPQTRTSPAVAYGESWDVSTDSAEVMGTECALCAKASESYGMFDREWWTPDRRLTVAAFTGLGIGIGATVMMFYNRFIRRKSNAEYETRKRVHARSWNVSAY